MRSSFIRVQLEKAPFFLCVCGGGVLAQLEFESICILMALRK